MLTRDDINDYIETFKDVKLEDRVVLYAYALKEYSSGTLNFSKGQSRKVTPIKCIISDKNNVQAFHKKNDNILNKKIPIFMRLGKETLKIFRTREECIKSLQIDIDIIKKDFTEHLNDLRNKMAKISSLTNDLD